MAITWICGFETGQLTAEPQYGPLAVAVIPRISATGVTLESTIVRTGAGSLKIVAQSGAVTVFDAISKSLSGTLFLRFYIRATVLPATARMIQGYSLSGWGNIQLNPNGTLAVRVGTTAQFTSSTALTDTATWYEVILKMSSTAGTQLWIDGVSQGTGATNVTTFIAQFGAEDTVAATYTAYFDDIVTDDASSPAASKVVLCVPTSISQSGSWLGGAGGAVTTAAVDFPPAGTATETDSTQIESVDSSGDNATDELRVALTTYTNAGVQSADTINAIMPFVWGGEDVSTGTKTGSFGMQANPADTYATFTYGEDIGALGTFTSNWKSTSRVTSAPSVTLSSSPVVAVRKTDAGTRVASVCAVGMYIDYTLSIPYLIVAPHLAINRQR